MKAVSMIILFFALMCSTLSSVSMAASRMNSLVQEDTTERLESIAMLKKSLKTLNLELSVLNTALEQARKKRSYKKAYTNTRKISDAITALTILGGAIASYHFKNQAKVVKIASFIGGLSSSTSVLTSLLADLSSDEANLLMGKIDDLKTIMAATIVNLNKEVKLLCGAEPSNQMCR